MKYVYTTELKKETQKNYPRYILLKKKKAIGESNWSAKTCQIIYKDKGNAKIKNQDNKHRAKI